MGLSLLDDDMDSMDKLLQSLLPPSVDTASALSLSVDFSVACEDDCLAPGMLGVSWMQQPVGAMTLDTLWLTGNEVDGVDASDNTSDWFMDLSGPKPFTTAWPSVTASPQAPPTPTPPTLQTLPTPTPTPKHAPTQASPPPARRSSRTKTACTKQPPTTARKVTTQRQPRQKRQKHTVEQRKKESTSRRAKKAAKAKRARECLQLGEGECALVGMLVTLGCESTEHAISLLPRPIRAILRDSEHAKSQYPKMTRPWKAAANNLLSWRS